MRAYEMVVSFKLPIISCIFRSVDNGRKLTVRVAYIVAFIFFSTRYIVVKN
jgi:hypothetical protein